MPIMPSAITITPERLREGRALWLADGGRSPCPFLRYSLYTRARVMAVTQRRPSTYGCGGELNYNNFCGLEVDKLIDLQSIEADQEKRRRWCGRSKGNWRRMTPDRSFFTTAGRHARQPHVRGLTIMVNSIFNGNRMEDTWLDR